MTQLFEEGSGVGGPMLVHPRTSADATAELGDDCD